MTTANPTAPKKKAPAKRKSAAAEPDTRTWAEKNPDAAIVNAVAAPGNARARALQDEAMREWQAKNPQPASEAPPGPILCLNEWHGDRASFYHGDCVEVVRQLPDNSVDGILYSPPFSSVYTYSGSIRDMGNCDTDAEFIEQYAVLVRELYRVLRPGRLCAVHSKDLVYYKSSRGSAGLRDFPGDIIRAHTAERFDLHSKVTIWKSPVVEMQRTKAHGLLYKQLRADSTISRAGCAEYLTVFRKWPRTEAEHAACVPVSHEAEDFTLNQWQEWASPVWMSVDTTNVLNVRQARDDADEKHMCPLQLDVIERFTKLYTNPNDVILSPFGGIGSEGVGALTYGRKYVGVELKESYFDTAIRNLAEIDRPQQRTLFDPGAAGLGAK